MTFRVAGELDLRLIVIVETTLVFEVFSIFCCSFNRFLQFCEVLSVFTCSL